MGDALVTDDQVAHVFKLLLIGDSATGKSSMLMRFTEDTFDQELNATIGVDFKAKVMDIDGKLVKLTIWDTAGQERFRTLTASYYRGAHGVIFVYDVTRRETFTNITAWLQELSHYATGGDVVKMLVGNKVDLTGQREVDRKEGEEMAMAHSMLFIEASAKTSVGVGQAFEELVHKILDTPSLYTTPQAGGGIKLDAESEGDESYCGGYCGF
eukprot:comp12448_c0_seq1/m.7370 comp12448_c0_seq1/g.7370  ORF comp12448_c0_seq1/g.7370 comp12448_c0_seq1/m.7370 type:complete len:212 (-) comp12448_c0_seq1:83-718(-)